MKKGVYTMQSEVWLYPGETAAWHFVSLPKKEAQEISRTHPRVRTGFGALPIRVTIGQTTWKTSIFPDKRSDTYLLPLKAEIRRKEHIIKGEKVRFSIEIL